MKPKDIILQHNTNSLIYYSALPTTAITFLFAHHWHCFLYTKVLFILSSGSSYSELFLQN